jgi:hypothetical protein
MLVSFPEHKVTGAESDHSLLYGTLPEIEWSHTSAPSDAFMAWTGVTLPFFAFLYTKKLYQFEFLIE